MARKRPGPRPRGKRTATTLRLPDEQFAKYEQLAKDAGHPDLNGYLVAALAAHHHLDVPWWAQPPAEPQTLDIPRGKVQKVG